FAYMYPPNQGGMRTTDRGSTQKRRERFCNRACSGPEGARPRDGLSSGAASWTDRARSERAARRASAASQSPLTAIFKKELVRKYGLLYLNLLFLL
ncbi:hypothetical protein SEEA0292_21843, partial [Salmonella enterica subsp. enterica serovar Agona str. 0292]